MDVVGCDLPALLYLTLGKNVMLAWLYNHNHKKVGGKRAYYWHLPLPVNSDTYFTTYVMNKAI